MAIATVAGGDWLARGHKAALAGADADVDEVSRLELLLGDVRDMFDGLASDTDRIPSAHLIEKLVEIVPRPWGEYGKSGKPITQNKLARLLKPLGIAPQKIRIGTEPPAATSGTSSKRRGSAFFPWRGIQTGTPQQMR